MEDVWIINKEYHPGKYKNQNKLPEALVEKMVLYSSNEKDIVCDFFLGNFTTAIVSKKLNRIPYGFELNKNSFDVFLKELQNIRSGSKLNELRKVPKNKSTNRGKPVTEQEKKKIYNMYTKLRKPDKNGKIKNKKETILYIGEKFGRGYFSILNILNKMNP